VLTNFGSQERLTIDGVRIGRLLAEAGPSGPPAPRPAGSCITVIVTDAPLDSAACTRLARRAGLGLARTGSTGHHGSGEIFIALATGLRAPRGRQPGGDRIAGKELDPFFAAVVEATEEAVLNSLFAAQTVTGRDGNISRHLPIDQVREIMKAAQR
jgi:D-aminopeptidase